MATGFKGIASLAGDGGASPDFSSSEKPTKKHSSSTITSANSVNKISNNIFNINNTDEKKKSESNHNTITNQKDISSPSIPRNYNNKSKDTFEDNETKVGCILLAVILLLSYIAFLNFSSNKSRDNQSNTYKKESKPDSNNYNNILSNQYSQTSKKEKYPTYKPTISNDQIQRSTSQYNYNKKTFTPTLKSNDYTKPTICNNYSNISTNVQTSKAVKSNNKEIVFTKNKQKYYTPKVIKYVQNNLLYLNFNIGKVDGILGTKTKTAIKALKTRINILSKEKMFEENSYIDDRFVALLEVLFLMDQYGSLEQIPEEKLSESMQIFIDLGLIEE